MTKVKISLSEIMAVYQRLLSERPDLMWSPLVRIPRPSVDNQPARPPDRIFQNRRTI